MKPKLLLAAAALGVSALVAPVLAQSAPAPIVREHKTITIAEAFPDLVAGANFAMHARRIELAPGARTEMIDRTGRPAITYVTRGEVLEHREGAPAPIPHVLHDATMDRGGVRHYWENAGAAPAELLVVELVPDAP